MKFNVENIIGHAIMRDQVLEKILFKTRKEEGREHRKDSLRLYQK